MQKFFRIALFLAIGWYLALCTQHYFNQRPLWNDEEVIFINIHELTPQELFSIPLKAFQVFPRVYLFFIQQFSQQLDFTPLALRFIPFICMVAAFFVWLKLARDQIRPPGFVLFVFSWSASALLVYYSAELKQYSMDVLAASLILLFLCNQEDLEKRIGTGRFLVCALSLPLLGFLSYPAFLCAMVVLYNFFILAIREKGRYLKYFIAYGFSLMLVISVSYLIDMRLRDVSVLTREWGGYFISFASAGEFFSTLGEGTQRLFASWFARQPVIFRHLAMPFAILGFVHMFYLFFRNFRKEKFLFTSLYTIPLGLYAGQVLLGALKKYAFTVPRTSLFFCPIVLFLISDAIFKIKNINNILFRIVLIAYVFFLVVISLGIAREVFIKADLGAIPYIWQ